MRYGFDETWTYQELIDGTGCTNTVFGDPLPGISKECYYGSEGYGTNPNAPDTDGDFVQVLGYAVTANSVFFNPDQTIVEVA